MNTVPLTEFVSFLSEGNPLIAHLVPSWNTQLLCMCLSGIHWIVNYKL